MRQKNVTKTHKVLVSNIAPISIKNCTKNVRCIIYASKIQYIKLCTMTRYRKHTGTFHLDVTEKTYQKCQ